MSFRVAACCARCSALSVTFLIHLDAICIILALQIVLSVTIRLPGLYLAFWTSISTVHIHFDVALVPAAPGVYPIVFAAFDNVWQYESPSTTLDDSRRLLWTHMASWPVSRFGAYTTTCARALSLSLPSLPRSLPSPTLRQRTGKLAYKRECERYNAFSFAFVYERQSHTLCVPPQTGCGSQNCDSYPCLCSCLVSLEALRDIFSAIWLSTDK
ncbi:hypothetical protein OG21DRAFT_1515454 [Imleria badia]|nr:hypothetical protein OG21DRAFT_1515454 [Imleria badia]